MVSLVLLAALSAAAADFASSEAKLVNVADGISQMSDTEYEEATRAVWNPGGGRQNQRLRYFASRPAALESVYGNLAAFEYHAAGRAAPSRDAEAVAVDPASLRETGWWGDFVTSVDTRYSVRTPNAILGVRGGRKAPSESDRQAADLRKSLDEASRDLSSPGLGTEEAARLHEKRAKLFESLSALYAAKPEAPKAQAPREAGAFSPRSVYQRASPAVVLITGFGPDGNGELGTGSLIDEAGHVLTNAHVVIRAATGRPFETLRVYLKPSRVTGDPKEDLVNAHAARVLHFDRALDLALLAVEEVPASLPPIPLGDSSRVEAGEQVVAIGHPEQGGLWTLTSGVVSTVVANLGGVAGKNVFQTDASINRGNSGGPLLDGGGALIGVNTSMARKAADGLTITSVNFSVKSEVVKDWLTKTGAGVRYSELAAAEAAPAAAEPAPEKREAPAAPAPAPAPEKREAPAAAQAPAPAPAPAEKPKSAILTPVKPYKIEDTLAREMEEMEDLEKEMRGEIEKRRGTTGD